jgi:hypothetical protein
VRQLMRGAEVHLRGLADFGTMEVPVDGGARVR